MTELSELDLVYRERAHLVAHLAALYPSCLVEESDEPGYALLYVTVPTGQLSWHIGARDLDLFELVPRSTTAQWDGHTTAQKYARLDQWTRAAVRCAESCAEAHTYVFPCLLAPARG